MLSTVLGAIVLAILFMAVIGATYAAKRIGDLEGRLEKADRRAEEAERLADINRADAEEGREISQRLNDALSAVQNREERLAETEERARQAEEERDAYERNGNELCKRVDELMKSHDAAVAKGQRFEQMHAEAVRQAQEAQFLAGDAQRLKEEVYGQHERAKELRAAKAIWDATETLGRNLAAIQVDLAQFRNRIGRAFDLMPAERRTRHGSLREVAEAARAAVKTADGPVILVGTVPRELTDTEKNGQ